MFIASFLPWGRIFKGLGMLSKLRKLGRGDGQAYAAGDLNLGRIRPSLPIPPIRELHLRVESKPGALATGIRTHAYFLVHDVRKAAQYYSEKLGFVPTLFAGEPTCFGIVRFGEAGVMLSSSADELTILPNWSQDSFSWDAHVLVDDARAHFEFCKVNEAKILVELRDTEYQMVEFIVQDIDGYAICFGQNV